MTDDSPSRAARPTRRAALAGAGACAAALAASRAYAASASFAPTAATLDLKPGAPTPGAISFGAGPGPAILRAKPGEELTIDLAAPDDAPLSLHWQGVRIVNAADGAAPLTGPAIAARGRATIRFAPPDPGFYCGRPFGRQAGAQLARGLYLPLIVAEPTPPDVDHDVPVCIGDARLGPNGALAVEPFDPLGAGRIGDIVTVNAAAAPLRLTARPNSRLRLRLLNAAAARLLIAAVEGANVRVIAIDGQPCDPFAPVRQMVPVGPGARFELLLDLPAEPGEARLILRGAAPPDAPPAPDLDAVVIRIEGAPRPARPDFGGLGLNPALPPAVQLQNARRADLVIDGGRAIDPELAQALAMGHQVGTTTSPGRPWRLSGPSGAIKPDKPLFSIRRGTPVSLGFVNNTAFPQTTHVHGHVMRLLHPLDDGWEPYWRDAVITPAGKTSRIAFVADNPGRWMIANADPDRAAAGLATWFEVT